MKSFLQFLSEARTAASQQAKQLGFEGDGHGGWYKNGEFVAKTVGGKLQFFNKRQRVGQRDPNQTEKERNIPSSEYNDPEAPMPAQEQEPVQQAPVPSQPPAEQPPQPVGPPPVPKTKGTLTVAFGRFNPPTIGHQQLMDVAAQAASQDEDGEYLIYPSRSQDKKKNPLDADTKVSFMRGMFPAHSERIVNDANTKTIFDVLKKAHNDGYTNVRIIGGADRVREFEKLSNNYNGQLYQFDAIEVVSAGERDPDAKGVEGMSASRMRLAASEGDFRKFREGLPSDYPREKTMELFNAVRSSMNIKESKTWEIAPKYDYQSLRENYIHECIFKIGELVENVNTGLVGKIIRRGTNYLICVTEDNIMFKSWIKDVTEAYNEKEMKKINRLPGKPNTLVGTDGYRDYVMNFMKIDSIKNFINKNKKKK
jgi:hypothetical protein